MNAPFGDTRHASYATAIILLITGCGGSGGGGGGSVPSTQGSTPAAPTAPATSGDLPVVAPDESCGIPDFGQAMLTAVNEARATARFCGQAYYPAAPPLAWRALLAQAAAGHSGDMAAHNFLSHTSSDGRALIDRIDATGYRPMAWAENVAGGPLDIDSVMSGWLASPGHCANIMNAAYKDIGAACVRNDAATYKRYWTQVFAAPR